VNFPCPGYEPIYDYGVIGDCHTAALVSVHGSIDWYCPRRFDAPSAFAAILDRERGGRFLIQPVEGDWASSQRYLPSTNVLETSFTGVHGRARVLDFMPVPSADTLIRTVEGEDGAVDLRCVFDPRFEYGGAPANLTSRPDGLVAEGPGGPLRLWTSVPLAFDGTEARLTIRAGERVVLVLTSAEPPADPDALFESTIDYWTAWSRRCTYQGPYRSAVVRSALALKLLTYEPSGAPVAAPTTSLPERLGGDRNWDYRFTWLRDGSLTAMALQRCGYAEEADAYLTWLTEVLDRAIASERIAIMYAIDGSPVPAERVIERLGGYCDSRPVRVGNGARKQLQLDTFGDVIQAIRTINGTRPLGPKLVNAVRTLANDIAAGWKLPDQGVWEMRVSSRHFTYSKAQLLAALANVLALPELAADQNATTWRTEQRALHDWLDREAYDRTVASFVQSPGQTFMDGSHLRLPALGVFPPGDPRLKSTINATIARLADRDFIHRYISPDGVGGAEGAFVMLSFWYVDSLIWDERVTEARQLFERLLRYSNPLGLYAEEIDPLTYQGLGNFPQAYSHLALINSAYQLLDAPTQRP